MKINIELIRVKSLAVKLRANYQLPSYLVYLIRNIDNDCPVEVVRTLIEYSTHMMRIKGYYKKYPKIEEKFNEKLKNEFSGLERN